MISTYSTNICYIPTLFCNISQERYHCSGEEREVSMYNASGYFFNNWRGYKQTGISVDALNPASVIKSKSGTLEW